MTVHTRTRAPRMAPDARGFYAMAKPGLDMILVLLVAPIVVPVVLVLALLVMCDGGTPFYVQRRVGRGGRVFRMWKLRTMVPDAESALRAYLVSNPAARREWDKSQKLRDDPRITPIGRFLRRSSLDELPQLLNVVLADMALVGPRPMLPEQARFYPGQAYYRLRPGVTGLWQISDRGRGKFVSRGNFDTIYEQAMSPLTDLQIILRTLGVVLRGTGT